MRDKDFHRMLPHGNRPNGRHQAEHDACKGRMRASQQQADPDYCAWKDVCVRRTNSDPLQAEIIMMPMAATKNPLMSRPPE